MDPWVLERERKSIDGSGLIETVGRDSAGVRTFCLHDFQSRHDYLEESLCRTHHRSLALFLSSPLVAVVRGLYCLSVI